MDWTALSLSAKLALATIGVLLPLGIVVGRWLAYSTFRGKFLAEALLALPLVLPPTVLGYYLLTGFGAGSSLGAAFTAATGGSLVFSFAGILVASLLVNLPFAIQPIQRAFSAIPPDVLQAAACCGMSPVRTFLHIEFPLAWGGIVASAVLTFAHTLGEFGVVLMVGGNIPGETRTVSIAIYDRVQSFDSEAAGVMAVVLLGLSLATISLSYALAARVDGGARR